MSTTFPNVHVCEHPLVRHKLTHMRNRQISSQQFYRLMKEVGMLMAYEVTAHLPTRASRHALPREKDLDGEILDGRKPAIVPILRSGLAVAEGFREVMPAVRTGHLGLLNVRNQEKPAEYLIALPETEGRVFIVVDAIIATGAIAKRAVEVLGNYGADPSQIILCVVMATDIGIKNVLEQYSKVHIYAGCLGELDPITRQTRPSLGDVGDRLFFGADYNNKP